ncbi:hypothetical protein Dda_0933 [Drechslerella dactyloides]|uniref:Uncharacterized protein n=1 Tax=Drechslerella dactyloides TaxID=74499 RepID=A0AAD6J8D6_DREDA|nr:hypothetical protein Dda_0933 [Drechslerella dactyloides]
MKAFTIISSALLLLASTAAATPMPAADLSARALGCDAPQYAICRYSCSQKKKEVETCANMQGKIDCKCTA